jgi:ribosomal protein L40E
MPHESLGYIKLEWTCPRCNGRNPGPQKTCLSCGAPQPVDVQFHQPESQELIKKAEEIAQAKAGPDIHCGFCGARNPSGTEICRQCGANLKEGIRRETGRVVGAFKTEPTKQVPCPNCGTLNQETALKCSTCGVALTPPTKPVAIPPDSKEKKPNILLFGLLGLLGLAAICVIVFIALATRTKGVNGTVLSVGWSTSIAIESLKPATHEAWRADIPVEATIGNCTQKMHHVQDQPADNSQKVCGTPYTVDKGSGYAEVVQDCQYEVYMDYCDYRVMEWQQVNVASLQGTGYSPRWAQPQLASDQRMGEKQETYTVVFETTNGQSTYTTNDFNLYQQCQVGSRWVLNINALGDVVSIEPIK